MMFGGYGGGLFLVDLTDMSIKQEIAVKSEVSAIAIIDQNNLVVGGIEGAMETYIKVQDDWEMVRAETLSRGWIRSISTSLSKWQVSVASESDRTIRDYALESLLGFRALATHPIPVNPVQQSKLVLSRESMDLDVGIRRVDSSEIEFTLADPVVENCSHYYSATRDWLFVGTERLRTSSRKYSVDVYHCDNWELIGRLQFPGEIRDISLTSDSTYLIATGWNGQTRVWDLETMKARDLLEGKGLYEAYACATRNGLVVVGPAGTNRLTCLRTGTWDRLREVVTESNWGTIQFAPRSDWLVVGETNRVSVWASDLSSCLWSVRFSSNKQPQKIAAMAISPDELTIVAYCFDGTLRFWDTKSRTELIDYQLPRIPVFNIRFLDSQTLRMATSEGSYVLKMN